MVSRLKRLTRPLGQVDWNKMTSPRILIFDTETASLQGGVCEIAVVEIDEDFNVVNTIDTLIDPERSISDASGGIHGIRNEDTEGYPTLSEMPLVHGNPFDHPNLYLVGFNVAFDCRMVQELLPESYTKVCLLKLARSIWPDAEDHKLQTLAYMLKLTTGQAHRALGDVMTSLELLREIGDITGEGIEGLAKMSKRPMSLDTKITFGKHKGTKLKSLPLEYINWLLTKADNLDPDIREALTLRLTDA